MGQMMGNLFFRGATPTELEGMGYRSLLYWNRWHNLMAKAEKAANKT